MKDKKKLSIILGLVGVGLIIFGIILSFISNVKNMMKLKRLFTMQLILNVLKDIYVKK